MKLGQTSVVYTAARFGSSIAGFLATVYFARRLGDAVLGQYALIMAVVMWGSIIANVGLVKAITKRISEGEDLGEFFGASLTVVAAIVGVGSIVLLLLGDWVDAYVGASVTALVVLLFAINVGKVPVTAALNGRHLVHVSSSLKLLGGVAIPLGQIGLVLLGWRLAGMALGYAIGSLLTGLLALWFLDIRPAIPRREHFTSLFDFAKYAWIGNLSDKFVGRFDITVLGFFVASGLVGIYSVVWSLVMFLSIFGEGIQRTLFPEMSSLSADGNTEAVSGLTEDALAFSGLTLIPGLVGGGLVAEELLRIYGPEFVRGQQVIVILIVGAIFRTYNKQLLNAINAIDRPDLAFRSNLVLLGSNAVLNVALIYLYGFVGAAVATMVSSGIGLLVSGAYVRQKLSISPPLLELTRQGVAAVVMGVGVLMAQRTVGSVVVAGVPEFTVVAIVGSGASVYFLVLLGISSRFRTVVSRNLEFLPGPV